VTWWKRIHGLLGSRLTGQPLNLRYGALGELAARKHLQKSGLKFLTANYKSKRGEIDLVFRDRDCLVFVEVKTRSSEQWGRPADMVDRDKRRNLTRAAFDYLRKLKDRGVKTRFDIVEVLLEDGLVREVRHLPNSFGMERPREFYGS
jgi:putative endonuclease